MAIENNHEKLISGMCEDMLICKPDSSPNDQNSKPVEVVKIREFKLESSKLLNYSEKCIE